MTWPTTPISLADDPALQGDHHRPDSSDATAREASSVRATVLLIAADLEASDPVQADVALASQQFRRILLELGYGVVSVPTLPAVQGLELRDIDLVVLERQFPDDASFELLHDLIPWANGGAVPRPVLWLDLTANARDRALAFQLGVADYFAEPFFYEEVATRLGTQLHLVQSERRLAAQDQRLAQEVAAREAAIQREVENKRYLRIILDSLPQQIFWKDANLNFLGCNQRWADSAGVDPESVLGKTDYELVDKPEVAESFREQDRQAMASREAITHLVIKKLRGDRNGSPIWLDVSRVPMRDEQGEVIGILGVVEDITDRRLAEEARRQAEEKYRAIVENAIDGIFQSTQDGKFLSINPALAKLFGYTSPAEALEKIQNIDRQIYVQPGRRQELLAYIDQFGEIADVESEIYRADGSKLWVSESVRKIEDESGNFLHYEGMARDITERRTAELEVIQQRQQTERLLLNILPQKIAQRLKNQQDNTVTADNFEEATVIFSDIVGFTELASRVPASSLVAMLNEVFSEFDRLAERHGVEKIKTIGDAYMAVAGVPTPKADHAVAVANLALEMQEVVGQFRRDDGQPFRLRIGIHSGPVVAGVIGLRKFIYDLWGDTVNVASRMESLGEPGRIQVTDMTYSLLRDRFCFEARGPLQVKGKGEMTAYWLLDRRAIPRPRSSPTLVNLFNAG